MSSDRPAAPFLCRILGHSRSQRLWHSEDGYRAQCKRCSIELGRARGDTQWQVVTPDRD